MGAELARSGADVSLIARGPHLAAMRKNGLKLRIGDKEHVTHPVCTDNPADLGPQDFIIVTLKAHSVPHVVDAMLWFTGTTGNEPKPSWVMADMEKGCEDFDRYGQRGMDGGKDPSLEPAVNGYVAFKDSHVRAFYAGGRHKHP